MPSFRLRLEPDEYEQLRERAHQLRDSMNSVIRRAVRELLERERQYPPERQRGGRPGAPA
jgi:hypothetical protein